MLSTLGAPVLAQERWFQVEVSIFSNESEEDRAAELWLPEQKQLGYPAQTRSLLTLFELLYPEAWRQQDESAQLGSSRDDMVATSDAAAEILPEPEPDPNTLRLQAIAAAGPFPAALGSEFRFPDFQRDAFLKLPDSESDFRQTNRALERAADYRLLYHGLWRQPMPDPEAESPMQVHGGQQYGDRHELEGSLSLHFNRNRDRVVVEANLWLSEFVLDSPDGASESAVWELPPLPRGSEDAGAQAAGPSYVPRSVYVMQQSREMRSTEFHYLDSPALGLVIMVEPYEVPELPAPPTELEQLELPDTN